MEKIKTTRGGPRTLYFRGERWQTAFKKAKQLGLKVSEYIGKLIDKDNEGDK